jgi:hypothetical protein
MAWVTPTSGSGWPTNPGYAWNDNEGDWAESDLVSPDSWTDWYTWGHTALNCDKVRIWAGDESGGIRFIEIQAYYNGVWNHVYDRFDGDWSPYHFAEYALGGTYSVTQMRARLGNAADSENDDIGYFIEADFGTPEVGGAVGSLIESRLVGGMLVR